MKIIEKCIILFILILILSFNTYSRVDTINCNIPASAGKYKVHGTIDTIYFSSGFKCSLFDHSTLVGFGSLYYLLIQSDTNQYMSYSESLSVSTGNDNIVDIIANNNWNSVLDKENIGINLLDSVPYPGFFGHYLYTDGNSPYKLYISNYYMSQDFDAVIVCKDSSDNYIKWQVSNIYRHKYYSEMYEDSIEFIDSTAIRWAIDSCGNGIFKYDSTVAISPQKTTFTKKQNSQLKINIKNNNLSVISNQKSDLKIKVFDVMGRNLILSDGRERSVNISALSSGVYFVEIVGGLGSCEVFKFSVR